MVEHDWLAERFEENRPRLRAVAYRMVGSLSEADDAVQGTWLRLGRSDPSGIENLAGLLTTMVSRECLDILRARTSRREQPLDVHVPDPLVSRVDVIDPEQEAILSDSVGLALLVVLEFLTPAERLAFVLHDMFGVPFDEIATMVGRSPEATRQLASRARRRVQGAAPAPDADLKRQWEVVDAYLAAAREGDLGALVALLDPDVVLRSDGGHDRPGARAMVRGALEVAAGTMRFAALARYARPALVNGTPGAVIVTQGRPFSVVGFTVASGKIVEIDSLADPARIAQLDLAEFID